MKHFFKFLPLFCSIALLTACNSEENQEEPATSFTEKYAEALSQKIELDTEKEVKLLPEAREVTTNWSEYLTMQNEIKRFKNASLQEIANNCSTLLSSIQATTASLPKVFQQKAIKARFRVMETKTAMLKQNLSTPSTKPKTIKELTSGIFIAFQNLKIQLNEVFLKTLDDVEKELEKALEKDSLPKTDSLKAFIEPLKQP